MSIASETERRIPPSTLQTRLQDSREWRGYTQADMAEVLGVSRPTVSNYERGVGIRGMSKLQINAWAAHCNVDVDWLKTGDDNTGTTPNGPGGEITRLYPYTPQTGAARLTSIMSRLPNTDLEEVA